MPKANTGLRNSRVVLFFNYTFYNKLFCCPRSLIFVLQIDVTRLPECFALMGARTACSVMDPFVTFQLIIGSSTDEVSYLFFDFTTSRTWIKREWDFKGCKGMPAGWVFPECTATISVKTRQIAPSTPSKAEIYIKS